MDYIQQAGKLLIDGDDIIETDRDLSFFRVVRRSTFLNYVPDSIVIQCPGPFSYALLSLETVSSPNPSSPLLRLTPPGEQLYGPFGQRAWTSTTGVLFGFERKRKSPYYWVNWAKIHFEESTGTPVGYETLLEESVPRASLAGFRMNAFSLPCDGRSVISSTLVILGEHIIWARLARNTAAEAGTRAPVWISVIQEFGVEEPGYEFDYMPMAIHEGVILLRMQPKFGMHQHPSLVLVLALLVDHDTREEKLEIVARMEDFNLIGDSVIRLLSLW